MREKLISLRYPARCTVCGATIPRGGSAFWAKGLGVRHQGCSKGPENETPPEPRRKQPTTAQVRSYDFREVAEAYRQASRDNFPFLKREKDKTLWRDHIGDLWKNSVDWVGNSIEEMHRYLDNGYPGEKLEEMELDFITPRNRRKIRFGEDGELQLDLALSGFDYPFLEWEQRERKPGMRVEIAVDWSSIVSGEIVSAFQRWIARALYTIKSDGFDCEINLTIEAEDGPGYLTHIRVKRENETADYASWSALFAPGGYRTLGFTAVGMHFNDADKPLRYGWHMPPRRDWNVEFDNESRTLHIIGANPAYDFPERTMTENFKAAIGKSKKRD